VSDTSSGDADVEEELTGSDSESEPTAAEPAGIAAPAKAAPGRAAPDKAKAPASSRAAGSGRVTPKGGATAKQPVASGRYTPPIPRQVRHSPQWFPFVLLGFLIVGLLLIVLNYVNVLPGGTSNWYLIGGIGAIVVGLFMATFYH
jgi:hypothetical protein